MTLPYPLPVVFHAGPLAIPAHLLFESLGYFVGFRLFLHLRVRWSDSIPDATRFAVIAASAIGAVAGSKLLVWAQHPLETWAHRADPAALLGGKTIVGGLLGGLLAVEWAKWRLGETRRTGDVFVLPLCVGMAIGRIGCFLAGLSDATYGNATRLPWGIDLGDGVPRHPAPLYEILALAVIAAWAARAHRSGSRREGDLFMGFMSLYLAFRLALEFVKPGPRDYAGLSGIQVACVLGLLYYARDAWRIFFTVGQPAPETRTV
jgi:prolipoprotein diacylglyceryltransferase